MKKADIPLNIQILNISVNMARIGNWIADSYEEKQDLINKFLDQTDRYLINLPKDKVSPELKLTLVAFEKSFYQIKNKNAFGDRLYLAEKALTWANILQHRAKLA